MAGTKGPSLTEAAEAEAEATATSAGGDGGEQEHSAKVPMPQAYVSAILTLKREPPPSAEYLERLSPEKREEELEYAAQRKELDDELEAFQAQIRQGVENNGYFLVDESYLKETAAYQAMVDEELAKLDLSRVVFGDWDYDKLEFL